MNYTANAFIALFVPGTIARLASTRFLVADSCRGVIWEIDAAAPSARLWLEDPTLARPDPANPVPGVNGLKIHGDALYFSNTQASALHRLAFAPGGLPADAPVLVAAPVNLDDFTFGPDVLIYGTTRVFKKMIRIDPATGKVVGVAGADVPGSAAAVFGATPADAATLYAVGNGGLTLPPPGGVQRATIAALDITQP